MTNVPVSYKYGTIYFSISSSRKSFVNHLPTLLEFSQIYSYTEVCFILFYLNDKHFQHPSHIYING